VPRSTLIYRISGRKARADIPANCLKLSNLEEASLKEQILDMDNRGLPPNQDIVRQMADIILSHRVPGLSTGKNWVSTFIKRHDNLISNYAHNMIISALNVRT
jgi:hypothetical protein